jgi:hypothetical protein
VTPGDWHVVVVWGFAAFVIGWLIVLRLGRIVRVLTEIRGELRRARATTSGMTAEQWQSLVREWTRPHGPEPRRVPRAFREGRPGGRGRLPSEP